MSHRPERKEKNCLNCGTTVQGKYCHLCGQQNIDPKETFWEMLTHFFNDITHFDGKFFTSIKWLVLKPGFLSSEYSKGRRSRYLHPIRMYIFTSALFFIAFYSVFNVKLMPVNQPQLDKPENAPDDFLTPARKNAKIKKTGFGNVLNVTWNDAVQKYDNLEAYDSAQQILPSAQRDGWLTKQLNRKGISLKQKYGNNREQFEKYLVDKFIRSFPYLLFVSLPLYALLLKWLYYRRKQFYYTDHAIFLIHLYIFTFVFSLIYFLVELLDVTYVGAWDFVKVALLLLGILYAYQAMRKFYGERWGKTLFKFIVFNMLCAIAFNLLFALFFIFSLYTV